MQVASATSNPVKFKYLMGEQLYAKKAFENLSIPDAAIDGNYICGNSKYIAVSILFLLYLARFSLFGRQEERAKLWFTMLLTSLSSPSITQPSPAIRDQCKISVSRLSTIKFWHQLLRITR